MKKRKIAVLTSSRADYGHLFWTLKAIQQHPELCLDLIVSGSHLSEEFGFSVEQIIEDGFEISTKLDTLVADDSNMAMAETLAQLNLKLSRYLAISRPDIILVIADRYEMLAPANAALCLGLPIVHIEGGDISQGAIDDQVRNALSKMSHFHFVPTEEAGRRLIAMGEAQWRVLQVGALSLDNLSHSQIPDRKLLLKRIKLSLDEKPILVCLHPVTISEEPCKDTQQTMEALKTINQAVIFCFPNADSGYRQVINLCKKYCAHNQNASILVNLEHRYFWRLMMESACMVGNSSSGIMETASISLATVDIGDRQKGRTQAENILHAEAISSDIEKKIRIALSDSFRNQIQNISNPYSVDNNAADKIANTLAKLPLSIDLLRKEFYPVSQSLPYTFEQQ